MDARKNGDANPFDNGLYCLEWIASAMDAARRYKEQHGNEPEPGGGASLPSRPHAVPDTGGGSTGAAARDPMARDPIARNPIGGPTPESAK